MSLLLKHFGTGIGMGFISLCRSERFNNECFWVIQNLSVSVQSKFVYCFIDIVLKYKAVLFYRHIRLEGRMLCDLSKW
jgi:hypothetical protein